MPDLKKLTTINAEVTTNPKIATFAKGVTNPDLHLPTAEFNAQIEQNKVAAEIAEARENATALDKYWTMSNIFDGTGFGHVIDYFKYNRGFLRDTDENFIATFDAQKEDIIMEAYGLTDPNSRDVLRQAKNQQMLYDLAEQEQKRQQSKQKVMRTYNNTENVIASLAVGIGTDPSVLLTGGATALLRGAKTLYGVNKALKAAEGATVAERVANTADSIRKGSVTLNEFSEAESGARVLDTMKKALSYGVVGGDITYASVLGATDEDTSMLEAFIAYGLLSPLDYKIVNGIKIFKSTPSSTTLGKNTVDNMYIRDERLSPIKENIINSGEFAKKDYKFSVSKETNTKLTKAEQERLKASIEVERKKAMHTGFRQFTQKAKEIEKRLKKESEALEAEQKALKAKQERVKASIRAERKKPVSIGFRQLVQKAKTIEEKLIKARELKNKKLVNKANKLHISMTHYNDISEIATDIAMNITDVKKALETIAKSEKEQKGVADDLLNLYRDFHKNGVISKSALDQIEYAYKKGKGLTVKHPKIEVVQQVGKNGKLTHKLKVNGRVVKAGVASSFIGAVGLNASDGSDSDLSVLPVLLALGVGAYLGIPILKNVKSDTFKTLIPKVAKTHKKAKALDETVSLRTKIGRFANKSRTALNETVKPMLENTRGTLNKFVRILYYDPLNPLRAPIGMVRDRLADTFTHGLERETRLIFNDWLKAQEISKIKNVASMFTDMSLRAKFDLKVGEYMTQGLHAEDEFIVKAGKKAEEYYKKATQDMIDAEVKGADKMLHSTDNVIHLPRKNKSLEFANKIVGISSASKEALIERFSKVLVKTPEERRVIVAEQYINSMLDIAHGKSNKFSRSERESLIKNLKAKGLEKEEIEEIISNMTEQFGRTKARLHMDYSKFGTFHADIDGEMVPITIHDLFDLDVTSVSNAFFQQVSGHIAFAQRGFKSVDDALAVVYDGIKKAEIPPAYADTMIKDINAIVGISPIDYSQTMNIIAKNISNIAIARKMVWSTISLASEGIVYMQHVLARAGLFDGMRQLAHNITGFGEDSFIASDILFGKDGLGLSQARMGASYGQFKTFDEFSNLNSGLGRFSKFTETWRDFTLHTLPFSRTSDLIQRANTQDILDRLYAHITGEKPLKPYELSAFPITPRMEKYLKENLELNSKGHVKWFDYTKAPYSTREEFKDLIYLMIMKRMNRTTRGTSSAFSRHSALGVALSPMLKYPMSAYSNLGGFLGRGVLHGDSFAMVQIALWFQAGIAQAIVRNEIQGREYTEEDLILAGLLNMPQSGAYALLTGLGNSPTAKMTSDMTNVFSIYNYMHK